MRTKALAWGLAALWSLGGGPGWGASEQARPETERLEELLRRPGTKKALDAIEGLLPRILEDQIALAQIPAPTGCERRRAEWLLERLRGLGLLEAHLDEAGNLLARRPGRTGKPLVILSAHLDTVFELDSIEVRRDGSIVRAPGVADDARGLASVLGLLRALDAASIVTGGDLWIAFTVGEEGRGDLKGVKHLYAEGALGRSADVFLTLDAAPESLVVSRALGSVRVKLTIEGQGGHSWSDFGRPNPIQALGRVMVCMAAEPVEKPIGQRASYNFGRLGGGTSVNAIPRDAWVEVDLRSEAPAELERLEQKLDACVHEAAEAEQAWARAGEKKLEARTELLGRRPSGALPDDGTLVRLAVEASRRIGIEPRIEVLSTDANVPISLGLQALALGYGGQGGDAHSSDEWYDPRGSGRALRRDLLLLLALLERPE
jgi:tripeptide aminopeptidase